MSLNDMTPVEIDTELARIWQEMDRPERRRRAALDTIKQWGEQTANTPAWDKVSSYRLQQAEEVIEETEEQLTRLAAEAAPFEDEYAARRWQRYFHVTNSNGHIHTSRTCETCFPDTQFAWRTDLSGLTEEEVVAREAYNACTVCLPLAPAEQKAARQRRTAEQREAKRLEREAKAAAKEERKRVREVNLAYKCNAALDKYGKGVPIRDAWYAGKITDSVYDVLYDAGYADKERYGTPPGWVNPNAAS
jgi:AraC-like DNA-binding protein